MKNINDLKSELDTLFGSLVSDLTEADFNLIISFILTNFAMDFPEVFARIYKLSDMTNPPTSQRIYLTDIHDQILEIKLLVPLHTLTRFVPGAIPYDVANPTYYNPSNNNKDIVTYPERSPYLQVTETVAIQLTRDFINSVSSYQNPKKPLILTDDTGEFFVISKDSIIIALVERILDINNIPEHIYSILRYYTYSKFIDFILNQSFANMIDMNEKIFNMMYDAINADLSSGDFEGIQSVSLGPLSVSFNNKINSYSNSLQSLGSNFANPNFINEMNRQKDKYWKQFKRKKNVFYNYMF